MIFTELQSTYEYICGTNGGNGSFLQKLNGADARLNAKVTAGPAKTRIEELENTLFGQVQSGSLNQRLERLVATTYNGGKVPVEAVVQGSGRSSGIAKGFPGKNRVHRSLKQQDGPARRPG